jgi:TetR/AcrR family transcriptional regulator, transcriptional repressor for nem operon
MWSCCRIRKTSRALSQRLPQRARGSQARAADAKQAEPLVTLTSTADVRVHVEMPRPSNKEKLLADGLRLVHERGFGASSVRDITEAAGVPQGSFTNHFASKEAFGLEILERYREMTSAAVRATLRNDRLPPLRRLRAWMDGQLDYLRKDDMRRGCLYGNLSAEASESSEAIRFRVASVFAENQASVAYCLNAAIEAGELAPETDVQELAGFIVSSMQGAILVAKSQRSPTPVERFERVLFQHVLRQEAPGPKRRARRATRGRK